MSSTQQLDQSDPVRGSIRDGIPGVDAAALATPGPDREQAVPGPAAGLP